MKREIISNNTDKTILNEEYDLKEKVNTKGIYKKILMYIVLVFSFLFAGFASEGMKIEAAEKVYVDKVDSNGILLIVRETKSGTLYYISAPMYSFCNTDCGQSYPAYDGIGGYDYAGVYLRKSDGTIWTRFTSTAFSTFDTSNWTKRGVFDQIITQAACTEAGVFCPLYEPGNDIRLKLNTSEGDFYSSYGGKNFFSIRQQTAVSSGYVRSWGSIVSAVANAPNGNFFKLYDDVSGSIDVPTNSTVRLYLNGKTLTGNVSVASGETFYLYNSGTVTGKIDNSGTVTAGGGTVSTASYNRAGGTFTANGTTFSGTFYNYGHLNVSGSTMADIYNYTAGTLLLERGSAGAVTNSSTASTEMTIAGTSYTATVGIGANSSGGMTISSLSLSAGITVLRGYNDNCKGTVTGNVTASARFVVGIFGVVSGTVTNSANMFVDGGSTQAITNNSGGTVYISRGSTGAITNNSTSTYSMSLAGTSYEVTVGISSNSAGATTVASVSNTVAGSVTIKGYSSTYKATVSGTVTNSSSSGTVSIYGNVTTGAITNSGTVNVSRGATGAITNNSGGTVFVDGGSCSGSNCTSIGDITNYSDSTRIFDWCYYDEDEQEEMCESEYSESTIFIGGNVQVASIYNEADEASINIEGYSSTNKATITGNVNNNVENQDGYFSLSINVVVNGDIENSGYMSINAEVGDIQNTGVLSVQLRSNTGDIANTGALNVRGTTESITNDEGGTINISGYNTKIGAITNKSTAKKDMYLGGSGSNYKYNVTIGITSGASYTTEIASIDNTVAGSIVMRGYSSTTKVNVCDNSIEVTKGTAVICGDVTNSNGSGTVTVYGNGVISGTTTNGGTLVVSRGTLQAVTNTGTVSIRGDVGNITNTGGFVGIYNPSKAGNIINTGILSIYYADVGNITNNEGGTIAMFSVTAGTIENNSTAIIDGMEFEVEYEDGVVDYYYYDTTIGIGDTSTVASIDNKVSGGIIVLRGYGIGYESDYKTTVSGTVTNSGELSVYENAVVGGETTNTGTLNLFGGQLAAITNNDGGTVLISGGSTGAITNNSTSTSSMSLAGTSYTVTVGITSTSTSSTETGYLYNLAETLIVAKGHSSTYKVTIGGLQNGTSSLPGAVMNLYSYVVDDSPSNWNYGTLTYSGVVSNCSMNNRGTFDVVDSTMAGGITNTGTIRIVNSTIGVGINNTSDSIREMDLGGTTYNATIGIHNSDISTESEFLIPVGGVYDYTYGIANEYSEDRTDNGVVVITSGNVYSSIRHGQGTLIIGVNDEQISQTPMIQGTDTSYSGIIKGAGTTLKIYDGVIKALPYKNDADDINYSCVGYTSENIYERGCNEIVDDAPDGYGFYSTTEEATVDGVNVTYQVSYLVEAAALVEISEIPDIVYQTVQSAIMAQTNATIKVLKDVTECLMTTGSANLTLNLNGKIITGCSDKDYPAVTNAGNLTINGNGAITSTTYYGISNSGTLIITNGTITGTRGIYSSAGTVTINGGGITGSSSDGIYIESMSTSALTMTDGEVVGGEYAIQNGSTGTISISGGTVTGVAGVWNSGGGIVNISGGTFSATNASYGSLYNSKTATITGGTFTGKGYGINNAAGGTANISGVSITAEGTGIINAATLNITSGTTSTITNNDGGTVLISGGSTGAITNNSTSTSSMSLAGTSYTVTVGISSNSAGATTVASVSNTVAGSVTIKGYSSTYKATVSGTLGNSNASGTVTVYANGVVSGATTNKGTLNVNSGSVQGVTNTGSMNVLNGGSTAAITNNSGGTVYISRGSTGAITNKSTETRSMSLAGTSYTVTVGISSTSTGATTVASVSNTVAGSVTIKGYSSTTKVKVCNDTLEVTEGTVVVCGTLGNSNANGTVTVYGNGVVSGTTTNKGTLNVDSGSVQGVTNTGSLNVSNGGSTAAITNNSGGTVYISRGSTGAITNNSTTTRSMSLAGTSYTVTVGISSNSAGATTVASVSNTVAGSIAIKGYSTTYKATVSGTLGNSHASGTVTVYGNGVISASTTNAGTLNVSGGTLAGITNSGTTNVNSGSTGQITNSGTLTVTGGTVNGIITSAGTVTIGTSGGTPSTTSPVIQSSDGVGLEETSSSATTVVYDGVIKGKYNSDLKTTTACKGYNGTTEDVGCNEIVDKKPEGYGFYLGSDGTYAYSYLVESGAQIVHEDKPDSIHTTIQDAINNIKSLYGNNGKIILLRSATGDYEECISLVSGLNITLDLAGYGITCRSTDNTATVTNAGTLVIENTSTENTGVIIHTSYYAMNNTGTITLQERVEVSSNGSYAIYSTNGSIDLVGASIEGNAGVNITGGTLTVGSGSVSATNIAIQSSATVVINGGTVSSTNDVAIKATAGSVTYNGGTLKGSKNKDYVYNFSNGVTYSTGTKSEYTKIENNYYVTTLVDALSGSTDGTIQKEIDEITAGGTITLNAHMTEAAIEVNKNITINLSVYTLNSFVSTRVPTAKTKTPFITVKAGATLTLTGGTLTLTDGTSIYGTIEMYNALADVIYVEQGATLNYGVSTDPFSTTSPSINATNGSYAINGASGSTVNYNNGVINPGVGKFNVQNNNLYIREGHYISYDSTSMYLVSDGNTTSPLGLEPLYHKVTVDDINMTVTIVHDKKSMNNNESLGVYLRTPGTQGETGLLCSSSDTKTTTCTIPVGEVAYLYNAVYEDELLFVYKKTDSPYRLKLIRADLEIIPKLTDNEGQVKEPEEVEIDESVGSGSVYILTDGESMIVDISKVDEWVDGIQVENIDIDSDELKYKLVGPEWRNIFPGLTLSLEEDTSMEIEEGANGYVAIGYAKIVPSGEYSGNYKMYDVFTFAAEPRVLIVDYSPKLTVGDGAANLSSVSCNYGEECAISPLSFTDHTGGQVNNITNIITRDGEVVESIDTNVLGTYVVTTTATDRFGYVSNPIVREYTVVDEEAPVVVVNNEALVVEKGSLLVDVDELEVMDNYDKALMIERLSDEVDLDKAGTYKLGYRVVDSSGNETIVYRDIIVKETVNTNLIWCVIGITLLIAVAGAVSFIYIKKRR